MLKEYVQRKLEKYVRRYFASHPDVKLVCITGSVGKTSTKMALANILTQEYRIRVHTGNHNTNMSAPLAILGIPYPRDIRSVSAWRDVFKQAKRRIKEPADVDIVIQELGTDKPGDIECFGTYLKPDITIVTGITPEHMEFFGTLAAVAQEELSATDFSDIAIINRDDTPQEYASMLTNNNIITYGTSGLAEYSFEIESFSIGKGYTGRLINPELGNGIRTTLQVVGEHNIRPIIGAIAVAIRFGMSPQAVVRGAELIRPVPGRMNILRGVKDSILIDDAYNSSPAAAAAAINTLSNIEAPQKIAILGDMNELGATSAQEHAELGRLCHPNGINWVVTIGNESGRYLAPVAEANGCFVRSFPDAISAGAFVHSKLERGAVVLAKGSQNGIFAEEALKIMLKSTDDMKKLVRQEPEWLEIKTNFFSKF